MNEATEAPAGFAMIRTGVILQYLPSQMTSASRFALQGDVARLDDGRLIARAVRGSELLYAELAEDACLDYNAGEITRWAGSDGQMMESPSQVDFDLLRGAVIADWPRDFNRVVDDRSSSNWHEYDPQSDADKQIRAFIAQWGHVAGRLGIEDPGEGHGVFPVGRCRVPRPIKRDDGLPWIDWRAYLGRHVVGDWGLNGRFSERKLTDSEVFAPPLFGAEVENLAAIANGCGLVRSRWPIEAPGAPQHPYRSFGVRDYFVTALTLLMGGGKAETLLTTTYDDRAA